MKGRETNKEGLTWIEWCRAATGKSPLDFPDDFPSKTWFKLRDAWRNGEDPTEHRKDT